VGETPTVVQDHPVVEVVVIIVAVVVGAFVWGLDSWGFFGSLTLTPLTLRLVSQKL
jgi:hypothetical protein